MRAVFFVLIAASLGVAHAAPPRVIRMVTAARIADRMPQGEADRFPAEGKVYAWARVDNSRGPATRLVFVWRQGERVIHRGPVTVGNGPGFRTWGRRWLHPQHAGAWTVQLETEAGQVLARRAFTVGDGPAPAARPDAPSPAATPTGADCRALVTLVDGAGAHRTVALRPNARRPAEAVVPGLAVVDLSGQAHALRVVRTRQAQRADGGMIKLEHDLLWGQPLAGGPPRRWAGFPTQLALAPREIRAELNHLTVVSVLQGMVGIHLRLTGRAPAPFDRSRYLSVVAPGRPADPTLGKIPDLPVRAVARLSELTRLTPESAPDPAKHDFRRAAWALSAANDLRLYTLMAGPQRTFRVDVPVPAPAVLGGPDPQGWWRGPCGAVRPGGSALMVRRANRTPVAVAVPGGLKAVLGVHWLAPGQRWRAKVHQAAWESLAPGK